MIFNNIYDLSKNTSKLVIRLNKYAKNNNKMKYSLMVIILIEKCLSEYIID